MTIRSLRKDKPLSQFVLIGLGLFVALPIGIYLIAKRVLPRKFSSWFINVAGLCGAALGLCALIYPFVNRPVDSGDIGIILLFPIGALLFFTCAGIMWANNRTK
jgi:hypothetical protein